MSRQFLRKVTNGLIQKCYDIVHPVANLHDRRTVSVPEKDVDRELQWAKAPSIEGLSHRQRCCWLAIAALSWCGCAAALAQTSDGYLWIAGPSGLFRFDGIAFERVELPHDPRLSSLSLFSAFAPREGGLWVGSQMGLPASDNPFLFVDSQGTLWAGGGSSLFFLRPGEHQFRNQPVAAPTPAFATLQSGWFIALCVAGAAAVVWALVRLRVREIRRRLEERMEERLHERSRISRELHDSLLQGFQGLMFRLQAVRQLLPPGDAAKFLDTAMEMGDQAIGEGRDAVQNLRFSSFEHRDLATSLSALGTELGAGIDPPSRSQYRVVVEGRPRDLTAVARDEAYRIAREAVSNVYRHAKAGHIETEVTFGDADLTVRVRDDGIGVNPQTLARGQRFGHWGLPGMRERSESFGAHLHVWSEGSAGTEVELRIPAHVAYAQPSASISSRLSGLWQR